MADFLTDYSGIAAAGEGFKSFAQAYQDAQDRQTKKQESQAKINAMNAQMDREATDQAIKAKSQGLQVNGPGVVSDAPASDRMKGQTIMEGAKSGFTPQFNENGEVVSTKSDPNSLAYQTKMIQAKMSGMRGEAMLQGNDIKRDAQSASAVAKVHNDSALKGMRQQATMIDKGLELTSDPNNPPSVVAMHEFAQDVSAALAGKAASSDMKLRSISTPSVREKLANLESYITSNPNQPAPPDVVKFWNDMGNRLKDAYGRQMAARANEVAKQAGTVYKHNPAAQKAQQEAAQMYKDGSWRGEDVDAGQAAPPPQRQAPAQGLVQPQQGFLSKMAGLVTGGGQQPAAQAKPQTVIQNGHTYTLNPKTGQYE